ncbi:hypothetical protein [Acidovorax soli]|nr:hypothetical protein [Acidovorax soli]
MPAQIFGTDAVVTILNRAFTDTSPANATFKNQVATAGTTRASQEAFAIQFGTGYANQTSAQLSNLLLKNLGVLPNAGLEAALTDYITAAGKSNVGLIALQLGEILSNLEGDTNGFAAAAVAWNAEVTAAYNYSSNPANTTPSGSNSGTNLVLTAGVDLVNGTSADDTIIADNTGATKQLTAADQINGGLGNDTLKIFLAAADTATGQPSTLTSIEEVYITGGAITAYTAATGTTKLTIDAPVVNTAATYTVNGQAVSLNNHAVTANTTTTIAAAATATATSQAVALNGVTSTGANVHTLDISGTKVATLDLSTNTAASKIALTNTGAAVTTLNVTGDKALTVTASVPAIVTVNAAGNSGGVSYAAGTPGAAFKFTGGAGNDTVSFADNGLALLTSGAQLVGGEGTNDKIGIFDTALTATETARINQATGFETLGLNANLTLDASTLTSIKQFSLDTAALTATISSLATGSSTAINANTAALTLGSAVGVTDTAITIGGSAGGVTATALTTTGITNVTLTSNGTAANVITTLTNSDNSVFTLKGAADLTLALAAGTAVGSKIDGSAATGKLTLTGSNLVSSGDVIIGGAGADTITGGQGADTLTGGAGADVFAFSGAAAANTSGAAFGQADVITDFVVGTDKLQFTGVADVVSGQQGAVQAAVTALAAGSSATAIATAMATASQTANGVSFAVFEGNTYVLFEASGAAGDVGVAANDVFIKLTGVTTLPTFANSVIA